MLGSGFHIFLSLQNTKTDELDGLEAMQYGYNFTFRNNWISIYPTSTPYPVDIVSDQQTRVPNLKGRL